MSDNNGNGSVNDEGLKALHEAFRDAVYPSDDARACAELMMAGAHRYLEIPDSSAIECYGILVEGGKVELTRQNIVGEGFAANLESHADLAALFRGTFPVTHIKAADASNDTDADQ